MKIFLIIIAIFIGLYLIDKIGLWLEQKGWLYYRRTKRKGAAIGTAMMELQTFLNPSARYTIEEKQNPAETHADKHN